MTRVDALSIKAASHEINQDYALFGYTPFPHAVICDGCSSSPYTDVGARIVAHAAQSIINTRRLVSSMYLSAEHREQAGLDIIWRAAHISDLLSLPRTALDTTLLFLADIGDSIVCFVWGDGYVINVARGQDQTSIDFSDTSLAYFRLSNEGSAPCYLSYQLSSARYDAYRKEEHTFRVHYGSLEEDEIEITSNLAKDGSYSAIFCKQSYCTLAIASDGLAAFSPKGNIAETAKEIVSYKTSKGRFVARRLLRMEENLRKECHISFDDLSVAGMQITEEEKDA